MYMRVQSYRVAAYFKNTLIFSTICFLNTANIGQTIQKNMLESNSDLMRDTYVFTYILFRFYS